MIYLHEVHSEQNLWQKHFMSYFSYPIRDNRIFFTDLDVHTIGSLSLNNPRKKSTFIDPSYLYFERCLYYCLGVALKYFYLHDNILYIGMIFIFQFGSHL